MGEARETRVYKKTSPNGKLTLYLAKREFAIKGNAVQPIDGVVVVNGETDGRKVFVQTNMTFRYGREDEEIMGITFSTDLVLGTQQVVPPVEKVQNLTPFQDVVTKKLGAIAYPFVHNIPGLCPASVHLCPAKRYEGAPIGISYDIRVFMGEEKTERVHRRSLIRMAFRVIRWTPPEAAYKTGSSPSKRQSKTTADSVPSVNVERSFLLSEGKLQMEATLDKTFYKHGEPISVHLTIHNNSGKSVKRIKIFAIQYTRVSMFSSGEFKNCVGHHELNNNPVGSGTHLTQSFVIMPEMTKTKRWIAVEDLGRVEKRNRLSPSIIKDEADDPGVFSIFVNYYVKIKLLMSSMGGHVTAKLPFVLMDPLDADSEPGTSGACSEFVETISPCREVKMANEVRPSLKMKKSKSDSNILQEGNMKVSSNSLVSDELRLVFQDFLGEADKSDDNI